MKIPKIENYNSGQKIVSVHIPSLKGCEKCYTLLNEKDKIRFIKMVETIIRQSLEYKGYIQFLKDEIDMTQCSFFENVSNKNGKRISIEIHHEPFTLFDLVQTVLDKWIDCGESLNPLLIASEVMEMHYKNMVGLIPLSLTVHTLVHDGKLYIPLQNVFGQFTKFIEEYDPWITHENKMILQSKLEMSKDIANMDTTILETKYTYLVIDGYSLPQKLD